MHLVNPRTINWDVGSQFSVFTCNVLFLVESSKPSSFEWLAKELRGNIPSKLLWERSKYSSEVRLLITEGRLPFNWLEEISRILRRVKFLRQVIRGLPIKFLSRFISKRFFNSHIPKIQNKSVNIKKKHKQIKKEKVSFVDFYSEFKI